MNPGDLVRTSRMISYPLLTSGVVRLVARRRDSALCIATGYQTWDVYDSWLGGVIRRWIDPEDLMEGSDDERE